MTNEEFAEFVKMDLERVSDMIDAKNRDYAGAVGESAFANFHEEAAQLELPVEKIWHVWFYKHYTAVSQFCKTGKLESAETIESRLDDIIGYALLLKGIIREEQARVEDGLVFKSRTGPIIGGY